MNYTEEDRIRHENIMREMLEPRGFASLHNGTFRKDGVIYDLSAADLSQLDRIIQEKLFVVAVE